MSDYRVKGTDLTSVADAIRTKGGTSESLSFPDGFVSAVQNIPSGGGSTLISKTITENGTYDASDDNADGYSEVTVNVPSKTVTGTFTGTTTGAAMNVNIPYTGSGYPIAGIIYPSSGGDTGDIASLAQKSAVFVYTFVKSDVSSTPTYTSDNIIGNKAVVTALYKYSDSDPTSSTAGRDTASHVYRNTDASATSTELVKIKSATSMSVYIAGTSYGFPANIEFTYQIIYSA